MHLSLRWLLIALAALLLACREDEAPETAAPGPNFAPQSAVIERVDLGTLGGTNSFATDVNIHGVVVGWSRNADGFDRAFRWTPETGMVDLGTLPGDLASTAQAILPDGRILGASQRTNFVVGRMVVWYPDGRIVPLTIPTLPGADQAGPSTDMNGAGAVIGWDIKVLQRGWYWDSVRGKIDVTSAFPPGGSYEGIAGRISASGWVVGVAKSFACRRVTECWRGMLWHPDKGGFDLGVIGGDQDAAVSALGVNNGGTAVGWSRAASGPQLPFRWTIDGGFETLGPAGTVGSALAINSAGTAVGAAAVAPAAFSRPALFTRNGEVVALEDPSRSGTAVAISENGVVAGWQGVIGLPGIHATVWRLGPGAPSAPVALGPALMADSGTATGEQQCLEDPEQQISLYTLFECVRRAGGD